jgi:hypothetical protein
MVTFGATKTWFVVGILRFQKWFDVDILGFQIELCCRFFGLFVWETFWAIFFLIFWSPWYAVQCAGTIQGKEVGIKG